MKKWWFCLPVAILLTVTSCNEKDQILININEPLVDLPRMLRVIQQDTIIRIKPEIRQTFAIDESNLTFAWRHSNTMGNVANRPIFSTGRYVDWRISSSDIYFDHFFWLEITDQLTGLVYPYYTRINVLRPFLNVWAVLHSDNGPAKLGGIEYIADLDPILRLDMFDYFGHPPLTGKPVALGAINYDRSSLHGAYASPVFNSFFLITTNPNESGVYAPARRFRPYIPDIFVPQMLQNFTPGFFDVSKITYIYRSNSDGGSLINDGRLFQIRNGLKWYEANIQADLGEIYITHALRAGAITVLFDEKGGRFLFFDNRTHSTAHVGMFSNSENQAEIRPMHRPANNFPLYGITHNVLHIGVGNQPNRTPGAPFGQVRSFAIANGENNRTFIYQFPTTQQIVANTANPSIEMVRDIGTPNGLDTNSRFASSVAYNNIVFFSAENRIYRLDFSTEVATLIYTHPTGGEIVAMRMAKQEPLLPDRQTGLDYYIEAYGHPIERSLGVAVNNGASGDLVVLHLTAAGLVEHTAVFSGFGTITDIVFLCDRVLPAP